MTNEDDKNESGSKAWAETAGKSVDVAAKMGPFLNRVFGPTVENGFGIVADRLKFIRWKQALLLEEKATALLLSRGVKSEKAVPPKIALQILENASLEEEDDLHTLWAELLVSAMTQQDFVKQRATTALSQFEKSDIQVLKNVLEQNPDRKRNGTFTNQEAQEAPISDTIRHLFELGILTPMVTQITLGSGLEGSPISSNWGTKQFFMTGFGWEFVAAVGLIEELPD